MTILGAILDCFSGQPDVSNEKQEYVNKLAASPSPDLNEDELASAILSILWTAEKSGRDLDARLQNLVYTTGWKEGLAERVLNGLIAGIKSGRVAGGAMKEAFEKTSAIAEQFVHDHPVFTSVVVTIVAIGILAILLPWALEALGFGELGPIEGSFAARWQSTFPNVEAGSIFAYLQRLGMKWGKKL